MTLTALLMLAEKATAGSRELDIELCLALSYIGYVDEPLNLRRSTDDDGWLDYESVEDGKTVECTDQPPELSASIDAALALVERLLPGWRVAIYQMAGHWQVSLAEVDAETDLAVDDYFEDGPTAPLAILRTLLRSLISQEHKDGQP